MDEIEKTDEPIIEEFYEQLIRRWPLMLAAIVVSVAVGAGVVFGGRSLYRHLNNSQPATKVAKSSHSTPSKTTGAATPPKSPAKSTSPQTATKPSLPNSGPGQVFELFAITSLGAAALHFVVTNKTGRASAN